MAQQHQVPRPDVENPGIPERAPRRRQGWVWLALGAVVAFIIASLYYVWPSLTGPSQSATHTVVYTLEADSAYGSGRTGIVTSQGPDGMSQRTGLLPITGTYTQFHAGDFVYVSVQNGQSQGSVTCRITVDGVVVSENTSTGGYTIATCQGRVP